MGDKENMEDIYRELKKKVDTVGWNIFNVIPSKEGEEMVLVSKGKYKMYCRGKGKLYAVFIPDLEEKP